MSLWLRRGYVPPRHIVQIETLYGVPRARLINPKIADLLAPPGWAVSEDYSAFLARKALTDPPTGLADIPEFRRSFPTSATSCAGRCVGAGGDLYSNRAWASR